MGVTDHEECILYFLSLIHNTILIILGPLQVSLEHSRAPVGTTKGDNSMEDGV
jgi:hypothetical protein